MDILKSFISGKITLVKTFWIFYFFPLLLTGSITLYRDIYYPDYALIEAILGGTKLGFISYTILMIIPVTYRIVSTIAVWNSSAKFYGRRLWYYIVRFFIVIDVAGVTIIFFGFLNFMLFYFFPEKYQVTELYDYSTIITLVGIAIVVWMKSRKDSYADKIIFFAAIAMLLVSSIAKSAIPANNIQDLIGGTMKSITTIIVWSLILSYTHRFFYFVRRIEFTKNIKYLWGYWTFMLSIIILSDSVSDFIEAMNKMINN
jgi:hypothetical protein